MYAKLFNPDFYHISISQFTSFRLTTPTNFLLFLNFIKYQKS